jgi:hypothetical protein
MKGVGWIDLAEDRVKRRVFFKPVMNLRLKKKSGNFLEYLRDRYFLNKDSAPQSLFVD